MGRGRRRPWIEPNPDHPRSQEDGKFVENRSGGSHVQDALRRGITTPRGRRDAQFRADHGPEGNDSVQRAGWVSGHSEHPGGMDWVHRMVAQTAPAAPDRQQVREDALDALNPRAALLRESNRLFDELGLDVTADSAVGDYLGGADFPIPIPVPDDMLDQVLVQHLEYDTDIGDVDEIERKLLQWQERTGRAMPETMDLLDDLKPLRDGD